MPHTETFFVSTKTNKVKPVDGNTSSYFNPDWKSKNLGKAKYIIEVFGYNHQKVAEEIRDIIDEKQLSDKLFHIRVETK
jgi:hypothetical protein